MKPRISVLIDTYNHERYIEEAVQSVVDQDLPASEFEILVVDDGSTDRTPEIVRKFAPRVRLLQKKNGGQASAFNAGIPELRGDLVALLDGDDVWLPGKLARVAKEFGENPNCVMFYHSFSFWNPQQGWTRKQSLEGVSGDILSDPEKVLRYNAAPTSSLAFRRDALVKMLPVPEGMIAMADTYLFGICVCLGPVQAIPECLTKNRIHGRNLWFAEAGAPIAGVLERRLRWRGAAITGVRAWAQSNISPSAQAQLEHLVRRWERAQEADSFRIRNPGRFKYAALLMRRASENSAAENGCSAAYMRIQALFTVIVGVKHLHYIEGIRTRFRALLSFFGKRNPQNSLRES